MVVQWLRICPAMQGTQVQSLVWEDSTSLGATKLLSQLLKPVWSKVFALQEEKPAHAIKSSFPTPYLLALCQLEKARPAARKTRHSQR